MRILDRALMAAAFGVGCVAVGASAQTTTSAFTYQGLLYDAGVPAQGLYDFQFSLFTTASGGTPTQIVAVDDLPVAGGLVNAAVAFNIVFFDGQGKWLDVQVRGGTTSGAYTDLGRQPLTPVPYANGLPFPFQKDVSTGNADAFRIDSQQSGTAIKGRINLPQSINPAVYGSGAGTAIGVKGDSISNYGVYGVSTDATGVNGESSNADGVGGISTGTSTNGVHGVAANGTGVRGDSTSGSGVIGSTPDDSSAGVVGTNTSSGNGVLAIGNLAATGAKTFVEPHPDDPSKEIRYAALEGPEVGTYFRGTAQLRHGVARIEIPDTFRVVTAADGLTVQLTPIGNAATLWCVTRSLDGIEIAGSPDVRFDYQVNGVRKAFTGFQPVAENTVFVPTSSDGSLFMSALPLESTARLIANGTLNEDGSVNLETAHRLGWDRRPGWTSVTPAPAADP
jgi:hypothetical protein